MKPISHLHADIPTPAQQLQPTRCSEWQNWEGCQLVPWPCRWLPWGRKPEDGTQPLFCSAHYRCDKHHDRKQLGEERVYLANVSLSEPIIEGSQGRTTSRAGAWKQRLKQRGYRGMLLADLLSVASSLSFHVLPRTTCLGILFDLWKTR